MYVNMSSYVCAHSVTSVCMICIQDKQQVVYEKADDALASCRSNASTIANSVSGSSCELSVLEVLLFACSSGSAVFSGSAVLSSSPSNSAVGSLALASSFCGDS